MKTEISKILAKFTVDGCTGEAYKVACDELEQLTKSYHAAQLEAGIKAKAIRKKGNPEKWIRYDASINKLIIEAAPCPIYQFEEIPILPADAELVDITIIVKP